jgi:hypothetical protein
MNLVNLEMELRALLENEEFSLEQLEILNHLITQKTDNLVEFRRTLENHYSLLDQYLDEIKSRQSTIERKIEKIDEYVINCMNINGKESYEGHLTKIKKRKPSMAVEIYDESLIPLEFIKVPEPKPTIMKAELAKVLKQGEIVEGARLIEGKASLSYGLK